MCSHSLAISMSTCLAVCRSRVKPGLLSVQGAAIAFWLEFLARKDP